MKIESEKLIEPSIKSLIGQRIRELRVTENLTISQLSEFIGISIGQLSRMENGKTAVSIRNLLLMCERFDRSLSYFFRKDQEIPKVLGTLTTVEGPENQGIAWFAREVARRTKGEISLIQLKASQVGSGLDQITHLTQGRIDIFIEELYHYQKLIPGFDAFCLPYLFQDEAHQQAFLSGAYFRENLLLPLRGNGIRMLNPRWNWHRGIERVLVSSHPVVTPEDLAGKRVRIFESGLLERFFLKLGAIPVTVPWTEVYDALREGAVDVAATHKSHLFPMEFCAYARYVTRLGDISPVLSIGINESKFAVLPPAFQNTLCQVADEAGERFTAGVIEAEVENEVQNIQTHGAVYLTVHLSPWKKAAQSVLAELVRERHIPSELLGEVESCSKPISDVSNTLSQ